MRTERIAANEVRLGEHVATAEGTFTVSKLFCLVTDKLVEIELRQDQVLKAILRKSPNSTVEVMQ